MSSGEDSYSTLEEHLELLRSPTLPRSNPNFESSDTPPPLVDAPSDFESSETEFETADNHSTIRQRSKGPPQPSLCDTLLIKELGPTYSPDIAARAGRELFCDDPESPSEDQQPGSTDENISMIAASSIEDVSNTSHQQIVPQTLTAPRRASEKLNDAIAHQQSSSALQAPTYNHNGDDGIYYRFAVRDRKDRRLVRVSITSLTNDEASETFEVSSLSLQGSPPDSKLDVQPPPKPVLPSLQINNFSSRRDTIQHESGSIAQSPALAKFAITPIDGHPSQTLAKIQSQPSPPSVVAMSSDFRQTLPSLETALKSVADFNGTPYLEPSPGLSKLSSSPYSHFGPSPAAYTQSLSAITMSPPRLPSNPSWCTLSQNSSTSTMSEYVSAQGFNNESTPASSVPGQSPENSGPTPQYSSSEHESGPDTDFATSDGYGGDQAHLNGIGNGASGQEYPCTWPGCTAAPFQTQYLLNSHTNVHSNQRPHFCPVKDCPRGPGGQGFKRKNEMIRYVRVYGIR